MRKAVMACPGCGLAATRKKGAIATVGRSTLMLGQGVHPKVVQERLGHSQVSITLNIYIHALPGLGREAIEQLGATLEDDGSDNGMAEQTKEAESSEAEEKDEG